MTTTFTAWIALIAALIAAGVTIFNSRLTRFTREKVWERKADAYEAVIGVLAEVIYDAERESRLIELASTEETARTLNDLRLKNLDAGIAIRKAAASGGFLISEDAADALYRLLHETDGDDPASRSSWLLSHLLGARSCLRRVVFEANKDLKTGSQLNWHPPDEDN
ncbi:MAG: hypothetical protein C0483_03380 [Pirellula sp.]|nr:hypothetical protein [Pirellula sp.]